MIQFELHRDIGMDMFISHYAIVSHLLQEKFMNFI